MRLVASASTALAVALLAGLMTGLLPAPRLRTRENARSAARRDWLAQAGLDLTVVQFRLASLALGTVVFMLLLVITGVASVSLPPAVLAVLAPRLYFGRERERRLAEVQRAWPDGLRDLMASIASGMSLQRALEALAETGPIPLRRAFDRFGVLARTQGVVAAMEVIREELSDPTSDRVIEVLILAHERGGRVVSQILADLSDATTRDIWTLEAIRTESLEQKINARAVFVLPWLVLAAITSRAGEFRDFYASAGGVVVVVAGGVMSAIGLALVSRLGREPEEPRVFNLNRGGGI